MVPLGSSGELPSVPGLTLHVAASDSDSLVLGEDDAVLEWHSSDESDIVFTPSSGASITLVEDVVNGHPVIRFDESYLSTESPEALSMTNDISGFTGIAVAWNTGEDWGSIFRIGRGEGGSASGLRVMLARQDTAHRVVARRVDNEGFQTVAGGERLYEEWGIDTGVVNYANASAFLYINGERVGSSDDFLDPGNTSPTDSQMFRIGTDHSTQYWNGDIAEIVMFDRALSLSEQREIELYLAEKYDIPYAVDPEEITLEINRALEVEFETEEDRSYQVLHSIDENDWMPLFADPIPGTGGIEKVHFPFRSENETLRVLELVTQEHQPDSGSDPEVPDLEGLRLQLDASATDSLLLDGNSVDEWHNALDEEMVFTPADPDERPTYWTNIVNGRDVVAFGIERFLETSSPAALGMTNDIAGFTTFAVGWNTDTGSQNYFRVGRGEGSTPAGLRVMLGRQTNQHRFLARRVDDEGFGTVSGGERLFEEWGIDSAYVDYANASAALHINGVEVDSSDDFLDPGNTSPTDSHMFRIGNDHSSQFWQGDIAEILMFDRALSLSERNEVGIYLSDKYNIPYTFMTETDITFNTRVVADLAFTTELGHTYVLEITDDMIDWDNYQEGITGTGFHKSVFVPFEDRVRAFFRVKRIDD